MDSYVKMSILDYYSIDMPMTRINKSLAESLFALMELTTFEKISIKDICSEALVSRSAFYQHFEDKYHLLYYSIHHAFTYIKKSQNIERIESIESIELRLKKTLDYVLNHKKLFQSIFSSKPEKEVQQIILNVFYVDIKSHFCEKERYDEGTMLNISIASMFIANGLVHTLQWWVIEDCVLPKEDFLDSLKRMLNYNLVCQL